jgi:hypothetical protein
MDGQKNYRKNTNQWIPNEQERSAYIGMQQTQVLGICYLMVWIWF